MSSICPINPPGHDWANGLTCRCGATRTGGEAIVEGLASRRGGDEAAASALLGAYRAEVRAEVLAEAVAEALRCASSFSTDTDWGSAAAGALRGLAYRLRELSGQPQTGREAAVRADALKLFLFHLEQSSGHDVAAKLLEDAPELTNPIAQGSQDESPAPAPDFFQSGHTYTFTVSLRSGGRLVATFVVTNVSTSPDGLQRIAQGWRREDGDDGECGVWEPSDADDITGWTDVTEAGAR